MAFLIFKMPIPLFTLKINSMHSENKKKDCACPLERFKISITNNKINGCVSDFHKMCKRIT